MAAVILNLDTVNLTDEQFYRLCQVNPDWQLERNVQGELRMNNKQLNGLFTDFVPFNPYFCRF